MGNRKIFSLAGISMAAAMAAGQARAAANLEAEPFVGLGCSGEAFSSVVARNGEWHLDNVLKLAKNGRTLKEIRCAKAIFEVAIREQSGKWVSIARKNGVYDESTGDITESALASGKEIAYELQKNFSWLKEYRGAIPTAIRRNAADYFAGLIEVKTYKELPLDLASLRERMGEEIRATHRPPEGAEAYEPTSTYMLAGARRCDSELLEQVVTFDHFHGFFPYVHRVDQISKEKKAIDVIREQISSSSLGGDERAETAPDSATDERCRKADQIVAKYFETKLLAAKCDVGMISAMFRAGVGSPSDSAIEAAKRARAEAGSGEFGFEDTEDFSGGAKDRETACTQTVLVLAVERAIRRGGDLYGCDADSLKRLADSSFARDIEISKYTLKRVEEKATALERASRTVADEAEKAKLHKGALSCVSAYKTLKEASERPAEDEYLKDSDDEKESGSYEGSKSKRERRRGR